MGCMNLPVAGFESAETFPATLEFSIFVRRLIPVLVMLFLLMLLIAGLLLGSVGVGGLRWVLALVVAVGGAGVLMLLKKRQFDSTWSSAALELSPIGATVTDRYVHVELPWARVREVGTADLLAPLRLGVAGDVAAATFRRPDTNALVGAGTLTVSPGAPAAFRAQVRQNFAARVADPESGQPLTAIVLSHYDPNWQHGRIGEWIRTYRPDILT